MSEEKQLPDRLFEMASIIEEFDLGNQLQVKELTRGSVPAYQLQTDRGKFFIKPGMQDSIEWIELYQTIEQRLNARGICQARLVRTSGGLPVSRQGYCVFEWVDGEAVANPNDRQFEAHVEYLARYNRELADVPITGSTMERLTEPHDIYTEATSIPYMLDSFILDSSRLGISRHVTAISQRALDVLRRHRTEIENLDFQLIHSDIGPGNIIYEGNRVISIIDFNPGYDSHLYSLCISLFWHFVFDQPDEVALSWLATAARIYSAHHTVTKEETQCFFALMVKAAAYRLFMRLNARVKAGVAHEAPPFWKGSTERMVRCVERVLDWERFINNCFQ